MTGRLRALRAQHGRGKVGLVVTSTGGHGSRMPAPARNGPFQRHSKNMAKKELCNSAFPALEVLDQFLPADSAGAAGLRLRRRLRNRAGSGVVDQARSYHTLCHCLNQRVISFSPSGPTGRAANYLPVKGPALNMRRKIRQGDAASRSKWSGFRPTSFTKQHGQSRHKSSDPTTANGAVKLMAAPSPPPDRRTAICCSKVWADTRHSPSLWSCPSVNFN